METRWLYTTSENIPALRKASKGVCVIPMGCVEKHGVHLPLGTDIIQASGIAYEASKLEIFTVFPDFTFGDVPVNYLNMPAGSITLPFETEMLLLEQLCEQIARNGYKKILIFNYHDGNRSWLATFLRKVENKPHNYVVAVAKAPQPAPHNMAKRIMEEGIEAFPELIQEDADLLIKYYEQGMKNGHACFNEIANMMGIAPQAVHLERLRMEDGSVGCNERIGKASLRLAAEELAKVVKFFKEDEDLIKWHNLNWNTNI